MTFPGDNFGEAEVDVTADTSSFEREVQRGVRRGTELADDEAREGGDDLGEAMAEAIGERLQREGRTFAQQIGDGLEGQRVRVKGIKFELDRSGNVGRRWVSLITEEIKEAFEDEGVQQGLFKRFTMAIQDAIGAGFNISGRSPLIAILIPAIGAIVALVLGAIQAVNGLIALLTIIPGLLASIGLQVGVVMIAFDGMGEAIQGAFDAKNAKELNEALVNLTPYAQMFVRQLLPLRDVYKDLKALIQENFFIGLGDLFGDRGVLLPLLSTLGGLGPLARHLGEAFNQIAAALGRPAVVNFIDNLIPTINTFLDRFGPSMGQFIEGLAKFAGSPAVLKFMDQFGTWVVTMISKFGAFLFDLAGDEGFAAWLDRMTMTLEATGNFVLAAVTLAAVLLNQLDKAGGKEMIDSLTEALVTLTTFLGSDVGQKGLEGLIHLTTFLLQSFTGLIILFLAILALFEFLGEAVRAFFVWLKGIWDALWDWSTDRVKEVPKQIVSALGDVDNLLLDAGRRIMQGLINGIKSKFPSLSGIMGTAMAIVAGFVPSSPAKWGPLSGEGDPKYGGEEIMKRLGEGITAGTQDLRNVTNQAVGAVTFGPGAIRLTFAGALPTEQQANMMGMAAGNGLASSLTRNTRLAVRGL